MLAPFGVEQGKTLTSACPGQGQTDSRTTTHSKLSWFPKLPDSNSQRDPWVTDVAPDAGRHPLRYQSELETGSLVPNFCHGSAVWLKGPKAKCQRGHVITWLYKIYIRQVKLTQVSLVSIWSHCQLAAHPSLSLSFCLEAQNYKTTVTKVGRASPITLCPMLSMFHISPHRIWPQPVPVPSNWPQQLQGRPDVPQKPGR